MPLVRCTKDGKKGWKVKNTNNCYTGKNAKKKAYKQWQAIELDKKRRGKPSEFGYYVEPSQSMQEAAQKALRRRQEEKLGGESPTVLSLGQDIAEGNPVPKDILEAERKKRKKWKDSSKCCKINWGLLGGNYSSSQMAPNS